MEIERMEHGIPLLTAVVDDLKDLGERFEVAF
jgi:hypothetical protein